MSVWVEVQLRVRVRVLAQHTQEQSPLIAPWTIAIQLKHQGMGAALEISSRMLVSSSREKGIANQEKQRTKLLSGITGGLWRPQKSK